MTLIELFADYVQNKKSLKEYVEKRKDINTRGEFNDKTLLQAQEDLERLKKEDPEVYDLMYSTLNQYYKNDDGHTLEYPIDFIRQILKIYQKNIPAQKIYECYKKGLHHECRDA
jgi:hypothetical protein